MRLTLYQTVNSPVHGLDPRGKLLALFTWSGTLLLFDDPLFLVWPFLALVVMAGIARVLRAYLIGVLIIAAMGVVSVLFWYLSFKVFGPGGTGGWVAALGIGLRLVNMLLAGILLLLTTRMEELLAAFSRLGFPYPAVFSLTLTLRLVPTMLANAWNVVDAQRLRGLKFDEGPLLSRARRYLPLFVPVLACSLRSVHQMVWALEAKGFGSRHTRVPYIVLRMRGVDWVLVGLQAGLLGAAVWAWRQGIG